MKKLILSLIVLAGLAAAADAPIIINLITTNDLHGVIYEQDATFMNPEYPPRILGGSALYAYIKELREEAEKKGEGLLVLDGGNFFQGTPFGMQDGGRSMIEWMNRIGYDALTPGSYDFILGADNLNSLSGLANFPFLSGNLNCADCPLDMKAFKPYVLRDIAGVKVAIVGIVDSAIGETNSAENLPGITALTEAQALGKLIPEVQSKGADVVIVLGSSGVPWDRDIVSEDFEDSLATGWDAENAHLNAIQMGYYADGVDVIVTGGVSKGYGMGWYDPRTHVHIFQNYGNGTEFGHIRMKIDPKSHIFIGYDTVVEGRVSQTLLEDDFSADPEMRTWIREINDKALKSVYTPTDRTVKYHPTQCSPELKKFPRDDWQIPSVNRHSDFEIITWNTEFFPANDEETILSLSEAIMDLDADMYAFQEIRKPGWFSKLMDEIPQYDYVISKQSSFMDQAFVFKKDMFLFKHQIELFTEDDYNYAGRPPMQVDFLYICDGDTSEFSVINLHMKCCDSGLVRRQRAVSMLHNYLSAQLDAGNSRFIVLGDWNDDLKDADNAHSFHPFFEDKRFYFPTFDITYDLNQASYPKEPYVSFLDHILVTRDLVPKDSNYRVQTILMDMYMGSYEVYEENISDHRPVMLAFPLKYLVN